MNQIQIPSYKVAEVSQLLALHEALLISRAKINETKGGFALINSDNGSKIPVCDVTIDEVGLLYASRIQIVLAQLREFNINIEKDANNGIVETVA